KIQSGSSLTDNTSLENQATPVHGYDSLYKIIGQQMKYPKKAVEENISGKVFISFDIDTEGNLTNSKIVKGIGAGCDEEALRVVQSLDAKWIPGVKDGQKINQTIVLPISFSLKSTNSSIIIENIEKGNSQGESSRFGETTDEIFTIVEDPAMPEGGYESFYKYIQTNMLYPETARNNNIEGRVFIQFVVDTDGSITQVQAVKGIGAGCDEEAIRVISGSPKWKPAYQRGITVKQRIVLPITFKL
ncbi:MAG: energy transducer TonB, partial [Cyclobacteriaceae bacterium]|nr:energy transducer TonB [Cyclobacteriaceae bacterium]